MIKLNLFQKIILKLSKHVFTEYRMKPGSKAPIPFYAFKCAEHGLVENYPNEYEGRLDCPKCDPSSRGKIKSLFPWIRGKR